MCMRKSFSREKKFELGQIKKEKVFSNQNGTETRDRILNTVKGDQEYIIMRFFTLPLEEARSPP